MNIYNMNTKINSDLEFKNTCPDHMKRYMYFLNSHHRYSWDKLKNTFPEYFKD